jgi:hypothetical protein
MYKYCGVHAYMEVSSRAKQDARAEDAQDDHMDVGGRILPGANIEQWMHRTIFTDKRQIPWASQLKKNMN